MCSDKSFGLNFNAITCESCKAFFRRNALGTKEIVCPFSNNCTITRVTRRFCQKCRLVKCFSVGMKKDHIMSEEEKLNKRRKIESNRAAKKSASQIAASGEPPVKVKRELGEESPGGDDPSNSNTSSSLGCDNTASTSSTSSKDVVKSDHPEEAFVFPTLASSATEIVSSIIESPVGSGRVINHLMGTPQDAILVMEKIINSPKDAIQLISHFINSPGDALKIISKIMNSPFDALTIFTKFMSSPTDALEVISKIISSPKDVLQFLQQLMRSPEDGLEIMNKFMNAPAEALRMINTMMNNHQVDSTTTDRPYSAASAVEGVAGPAASSMPEEQEQIIDDNLVDIQPSDSIVNNSAQLKVILDRMGEHLNGGSPSPSSNVPTSTSTAEGEEEEEIKMGGGEKQNLPPFSLPFSLVSGMGGLSGGPPTAQDIIDMCINQTVNSMDSVLSEAIKLEYECAMPVGVGMPNASPSSMYLNGGSSSGSEVRPLNEVEQAKLNELILAHQALYAPVNEDISSLIADDYRLKVSKGRSVIFWFKEQSSIEDVFVIAN